MLASPHKRAPLTNWNYIKSWEDVDLWNMVGLRNAQIWELFSWDNDEQKPQHRFWFHCFTSWRRLMIFIHLSTEQKTPEVYVIQSSACTSKGHNSSFNSLYCKHGKLKYISWVYVLSHMTHIKLFLSVPLDPLEGVKFIGEWTGEFQVTGCVMHLKLKSYNVGAHL